MSVVDIIVLVICVAVLIGCYALALTGGLPKKYKEDREKERTCDNCKNKKTYLCPNSSLCYSTEDKPYFKAKGDK